MVDTSLILNGAGSIATVGVAVFGVMVLIKTGYWLRNALGFGWDYTATDKDGDASGEPWMDGHYDDDGSEERAVGGSFGEYNGEQGPEGSEDELRTYFRDSEAHWQGKDDFKDTERL